MTDLKHYGLNPHRHPADGFCTGIGTFAVILIALFYLLALVPAQAGEPVRSGTGGVVEGLQVEPKPGLAPAAPLELATGGAVLTEQQFYSLARKTFFANDWVVIAAADGAVTAKKHASHFFGFGTVPVNDKLQWDETAKAFVYRAEIRLSGEKIVIRYLPSWGATSDRLLSDLRKSLALVLY